MTDQGAARGELVRHLRNALAIADELEDRKTGHLIKQALDQAQSQKGDHEGNLSAPPSTA
jgi:DNA-binding ferritin-like protein